MSVLDSGRYPLELIVIDDGSGPEVRQALADILNRPGVSYRYQENSGLASALNRGVELASGSFVSWTSADNHFKPAAIDRLADFLMSNPDVGLVYANMELIDGSGGPAAADDYRPQNQPNRGSHKLLLPIAAQSLGEDHDNFFGACHLMRMSLRSCCGAVDTKLRGAEDFDYWLRCCLCSTAAHLDSDDMLYEYRLHTDSISHQLGPEEIEREAREVAATFRRRRSSRDELPSAAGLDTSAFAKQLGLRVLVLSKQDPTTSFEKTFIERGSAIDVHDEQGSEAVLLPALRKLPLLLRSRGADYRAIELNKPQLHCGLIICPSRDDARARDALLEAIVADTDCTYALLCEDEPSREFADRLHLSLGSGERLRIIDLSRESRESLDAYQHSLMYVLSNCDFVAAALPQDAQAEVLLDFRLKLSPAAHAGIPLIGICDPDWDKRTDSGALGAKLREEIYCSPHTMLLGRGAAPSQVLKAEIPFSQAGLDKWLDAACLKNQHQLLRGIRSLSA